MSIMNLLAAEAHGVGIGQFPLVVGGEGGGAPACAGVGDGVAASCTVSPLCKVSGGLSITRSCGVRPAVTSTLSPKSRPIWTDFNATLLSAPTTATCTPRFTGINAVAGMRTMGGE